MEMSDEEIRKSYIQSKNPNNQIKILSELNDCSVEEIQSVLGIKPQLKRTEAPNTDVYEEWLISMLNEADMQIKAWEEKYICYEKALRVHAEFKSNLVGGKK